jgi:HAD superfamily hydrolase (TIGR01450 family)
MSGHARRLDPRQRPAHDGAEEALAAVRAIGFDLDGTLYLQDSVLPGARELVELLSARGIRFAFATNNSSRSGTAYVEHLSALGFPATREGILTSNDVAASYLRRAGLTRPYLLATPEVTAEYEALGLRPGADEPDCVLLTFDTTLTYDKLRLADRLIRRGLPYLATHPDRVCPTSHGPIPDCGAFIALLSASTGAEPRILGKPEPPMATALQERLGTPAGEIAFVGDRLYTDVRMANANGFVAVLTLTGETTVDDVDASPDRPDVVVETLDQLAELLLDAWAPARPGPGSRR